jgi:lipoprotein-releasing system permease protein
MSPNFRIALRFLTAKKRSMVMSLSCIILGVGLFVVTQATTRGFEGFFIKTILGTDGAMRVEDKRQSTIQSVSTVGYGSPFEVQVQSGKYIEGIDYPGELMRTLLTFPNVAAASEVLHGSNVTIRSSFKDDTVQVFGINLDDQLRVSDLGNQISEGSIYDFRTAPDGALIGRMMADRQHLSVGDTFQLETKGQTRVFRVSAIYETGVEDIDKVRLYLKMEQARSLLQKPTGASYLQVSLHDKDRAHADSSPWMEDILDHRVAAWQDREKEWLGVFRALGISTGITVLVFTLIAGLAMFNTLAMIVMEKTKEIAILRSMGYTRRDISSIFLWQAMIVLAFGSIGGCLLGLAGTYGVSQVPLPIHTIFKTDKFIVTWNPWHYVEAVGASIVMVMVASLIPSRRAARLEPGDIIRGSAQ